MKNIELYEFFNFSGKKEKDRKFDILYSGPNGLVIESEYIEDCYHFLPELRNILNTKPDFDSPVIIFFSKGKSAGGFEDGASIATNNNPTIIEENIIRFLENYNIYL
jgi:hypothetical protein